MNLDWREARRQSARAAIVDAAWALVADEGLAGLAIRDLARRAGITTPTVYSYFESKNAIYDAMFGQAAEEFANYMAEPFGDDDPDEELLAYSTRYVEFCASDVARYQLLFQRVIPGFEPSPESFAPSVRALKAAGAVLARNGFTEPRQLDMWTALVTGIADQQISNDPGGDRWILLIEDFVTMFVDHRRSQEQTQPRQSRRGQPKGKKS
jgi:AcrR family transcriptional regulator